jgi:TRAP-type C4-dicarboxylate transport system permease small subunit
VIKKIFLKIDYLIDRISFWAMILSGVLIIFMSLLNTYGVGRRYILHNPEPYSYELATIFLVICVALSIAYLQRQGRHLRVDFCAAYFSRAVEYFFLNIISPLLALTYVGIITWQSWLNGLYSWSIQETSQSAWQELLAPTKISVSFGMFLLCLVLLAQLIRGIVYLATGKAKEGVKVGKSPTEGS